MIAVTELGLDSVYIIIIFYNYFEINLNMAGYESKQIFDWLKALNLIKEESFDLIFMDIMLPGMDGFELIKKISNLNIPVIFLTAKNGLADKVTGLKSGAEEYIVKPFETVELLARIETEKSLLIKLKEKNITLIIEGEDCTLYMDKDLIKMALCNYFM